MCKLCKGFTRILEKIRRSRYNGFKIVDGDEEIDMVHR